MSIYNCVAQGDPFFGFTTIEDYIKRKRERLKKQYEENYQELPRWFEIEGAHAYMFPEKNILYWAIKDHSDLGLRSGQLGRCIHILDNGM